MSAPQPVYELTDVDQQRVGQLLDGKLKLESVVGKGGMGVVYAAHHLLLDRRVAVKVLNAIYAQDSRTVSRFLSEARAAAKIVHPSVVSVFDMGRAEDGSAYIALELLRGRTLREALDQDGPMTPLRALEALGPIMDALAAAHDVGIIHRDVKPENVFLADVGGGKIVPKLLDFGVAKLQMLAPELRHTRSGNIVGTPLYMSPEQASQSKDVGPAADVWSMGVVLYEALSGVTPLEDTNPAQFFVDLLTRDSMPLGLKEPRIPPQVAAAVDGALKRDVSARYKSMREMADAFAEAVASAPITEAPPRMGPRPVTGETETLPAAAANLALPRESGIQQREVPPAKRGIAWIVGAAVTLVVGAAAAWMLWPRTDAGSSVVPPSTVAVPPAGVGRPPSPSVSPQPLVTPQPSPSASVAPHISPEPSIAPPDTLEPSTPPTRTASPGRNRRRQRPRDDGPTGPETRTTEPRGQGSNRRLAPTTW